MGLVSITGRKFFERSLFHVSFEPPYAKPLVVFTEFGPLKGNAAEKTVVQSGHTVHWRGPGVVSHDTVTMRRALSQDDAADATSLDHYLYRWWLATKVGTDDPIGTIKRNCIVTHINRAGEEMPFKDKVLGMVPLSYVGFEGDAESDDVIEETMEVGIEDTMRIDKDSGEPIELPDGTAPPTAE